MRGPGGERSAGSRSAPSRSPDQTPRTRRNARGHLARCGGIVEHRLGEIGGEANSVTEALAPQRTHHPGVVVPYDRGRFVDEGMTLAQHGVERGEVVTTSGAR